MSRPPTIRINTTSQIKGVLGCTIREALCPESRQEARVNAVAAKAPRSARQDKPRSPRRNLGTLRDPLVFEARRSARSKASAGKAPPVASRTARRLPVAFLSVDPHLLSQAERTISRAADRSRIKLRPTHGSCKVALGLVCIRRSMLIEHLPRQLPAEGRRLRITRFLEKTRRVWHNIVMVFLQKSFRPHPQRFQNAP